MSTTVWQSLLARRSQRLARSQVREFTKLLTRSDVIFLAGGFPDPQLLPVLQLRAAYDRVLGDPRRGAIAVQYAESEGHEPLRRWICEYLRARGIGCTCENILIVNGSQQGLDLIGKIFLDPGDTVAVSSPTYAGALGAFSAYEPEYAVLPRTDDEFAIEQFCKTRPKLIYAMADFQNPTGSSLTLEERHELADTAKRAGALLVEDDAYAELRYDGEPMPPLTAVALESRSIDDGDNVYLGTFSKSVAPGLRLGWIVAPRGVMDKLVPAKQSADLQASTINQIVLTEFLQQDFTSWSQHIRAAYRQRRDVMVAALESAALKGCKWSRPAGGYFVWVEGPPELDAQSLLDRAVNEVGVAFVAGQPFHADGTGRNTMRLSFSHAPLDQLVEGARRLARVLG